MPIIMLNLILLFHIAYLFSLSKRYLHMLQLNSYFNSRLVNWYKKNFLNEVRLKDFLPLVSLPFYFSGHYWIFTAVWTLAYLLLIAGRKKTQEKKKFVITDRIKRLYVTHFILWLGLLLLLNAIYSACNTWGMLIILAFIIVAGALKIVYLLLANTLNWPVEELIKYYYYNDARKILRQSNKLVVIGITGSYGKTSSKYILSTILGTKFNVLMTPESYNTLMGVVRTIREKLKPTHDVFIVEMGARQPGDIKEICRLVKPRYGLLTSIGYQHLETFKTIKNIIATKFELVNHLADQGTAFLNFENEFIRKEKISRKFVSYGINNNTLDYWAEDISYDSKGASFTLCGSKVRIPLRTKLLGIHNVLNIVAAGAIALELGVKQDDLFLAVKQLQPVPHRLELKPSQGVTVIDNAFNSNPEGAKESINVLSKFDSRRKILITPGLVELGDKEYEFNFELGEKAALACDYIILVGIKRSRPIYEGIMQNKFDPHNVFVVRNLNEALIKMKEIAIQGSVVLFENDLPDDYEE